MFCSLNSASRLDPVDLRAIGQHFSRDSHENVDKILTKQRRNFESDGLIEPDANPMTEDESDTETQTQEWPAWESVSYFFQLIKLASFRQARQKAKLMTLIRALNGCGIA
jgi:hypothetical protein